jgi:hypothetical protein
MIKNRLFLNFNTLLLCRVGVFILYRVIKITCDLNGGVPPCHSTALIRVYVDALIWCPHGHTRASILRVSVLPWKATYQQCKHTILRAYTMFAYFKPASSIVYICHACLSKSAKAPARRHVSVWVNALPRLRGRCRSRAACACLHAGEYWLWLRSAMAHEVSGLQISLDHLPRTSKFTSLNSMPCFIVEFFTS